MKEFKVGQKVYVVNNSTWGLKPMVVVFVSCNSGLVTCKHPEMREGGFHPEDLILANSPESKKRNRLIVRYKRLERELDKLREKIFSKPKE